jgi:VWFA-related protein
VVFTVTSTLVQLDAVVADSKGRNVSDLNNDDFEVLIDGKPQPLTHFSYVPVSAEPHPAEPAPTAKSNSGLLPPPSSPLRPEDVRRTIVLMVDDLGLSFESMAFVRTSLRKFVENQMQPRDLVAVVRTGVGSGALEQFTSDKRVLLAIINGLRWNPNGRSGISVREPIGNYVDRARLPNGAESAMDVRYELRNRTISTVGTLGAISHIIDALREMPGRKSIALFSDGMQLFTPGVDLRKHVAGDSRPLIEENSEVMAAMRKLIDRANRAGTVIYTMQATGLQTGQLDAADRVGNPADLRRWTEVGQIGGLDWQMNVNQQGLAFLADHTGGLAYDNGNDLNFGLDRMLEDQKGYYLLGFRPPDGLFPKEGKTPDFHRVTVKVNRAGLRVRSRWGFFGETDDEMRPGKPRTTLGQMAAAMVSPFQSSGVRLRLTALYGETAKGKPVVRNLVHIDANDLTWKPTADGSVSAGLQIVAVATGADDMPLNTVTQGYTLKVEAAKLAGALRDGAVYQLDVPVPKIGAYQVRVAVRDDGSAKVGSASQFIEIPDLKHERFALASIVLQDGAVRSAKADFAAVTPARRQFRQGGELEYLCAVEKGGAAHASTNLATEIEILRDGKAVYSADAKIVDVPQSGPAVFGALRLTDKLVPGEYYLHVIAKDPRGGKNAAADQWTDFEVVE